MKYSIGYKLPDARDCLPQIVSDYRKAVAEVYFALPGESSGRLPLGLEEGWNLSDAENVLRGELAEISQMKVACVILFNSSCYGAQAQSSGLEDNICRKIENLLQDKIYLVAVTTTSPFIAGAIRTRFPELEIRGSVNMRVGSIEAMEYLSDCFDAFYMQREYNRDIEYIRKLKNWCNANSRKLLLLANSGCLRFCSFQNFHDNLVAHEIDQRQDGGTGRVPAPCWRYLEEERNRWQILRNTWIRPEDIHHYDDFFPIVKLATRMHDNPRKVIASYASRNYNGNLLELMEPSYIPLFGDSIVDNKLFPSGWFETTSQCSSSCSSCKYCESVFQIVCRPLRKHSHT